MQAPVIRSDLSASQVQQEVRALFAQMLGLPPEHIDETEPLSDYGINSVDMIDAAVKLEARFGIQFDPQTLRDLSCRGFADSIRAAGVGAWEGSAS